MIFKAVRGTYSAVNTACVRDAALLMHKFKIWLHVESKTKAYGARVKYVYAWRISKAFQGYAT